jgi:hypothetical protein
MKVDYKCGHCGSTEILRDAYATWNAEKQRMELESTFDMAFCRGCDGETKNIVEIPYVSKARATGKEEEA